MSFSLSARADTPAGIPDAVKAAQAVQAEALAGQDYALDQLASGLVEVGIEYAEAMIAKLGGAGPTSVSISGHAQAGPTDSAQALTVSVNTELAALATPAEPVESTAGSSVEQNPAP